VPWHGKRLAMVPMTSSLLAVAQRASMGRKKFMASSSVPDGTPVPFYDEAAQTAHEFAKS